VIGSSFATWRRGGCQRRRRAPTRGRTSNHYASASLAPGLRRPHGRPPALCLLLKLPEPFPGFLVASGYLLKSVTFLLAGWPASSGTKTRLRQAPSAIPRGDRSGRENRVLGCGGSHLRPRHWLIIRYWHRSPRSSTESPDTAGRIAGLASRSDPRARYLLLLDAPLMPNPGPLVPDLSHGVAIISRGTHSLDPTASSTRSNRSVRRSAWCGSSHHPPAIRLHWLIFPHDPRLR